jgi:predicted nucleic acid-binding protein
MGLILLFRGFETGLLRLLLLDETAIPPIAEFLQRYRGIGAQVADAALVYLAEREETETVFTLDRRDFPSYRLRGNRSLRLLPPP